MYREDDEEYKKRLERAKLLRTSIGVNTDEELSNNAISIQYDNEYQQRLNKARELRNNLGITTDYDIEPENIIQQPQRQSFTELGTDITQDVLQENNYKTELENKKTNNIFQQNDLEPSKKDITDVVLNKKKPESLMTNEEKLQQQKHQEQVKQISNETNSDKNPFSQLGKTIENFWLGITSNAKAAANYITDSQHSKEQEIELLSGSKDLASQVYKDEISNGRNTLSKAQKRNVDLRQNLNSLQNNDNLSWTNKKNTLNTPYNNYIEQNLTNELNSKRDAYGDIELSPLQRELSKSIADEENKIATNTNKIENPIIKKISELAPSTSNSLFGAGLSMINPYLGMTYFMISASGMYEADGRSRGMNREEAREYGTIMGFAEGATEMLEISNLLKAGSSIRKGAFKEALKHYGIDMADNAVQEAIIDPIDELTSQITSGKTKHDYSTKEGWKELGKDMIQDGIDGALSSLLMNGIDLGINSSVSLYNKIKNGDTITNQDIVDTYTDINNNPQINVKQHIKSSMEHQKDKLLNNSQQIYSFVDINDDNTINVKTAVGTPIKLINKDFNISPVVIYDDGYYNVIDENSKIKLDTTPYNSVEEAQEGFNSIIENADKSVIDTVNSKVLRAEVAWNEKILEIQKAIEENPQILTEGSRINFVDDKDLFTQVEAQKILNDYGIKNNLNNRPYIGQELNDIIMQELFIRDTLNTKATDLTEDKNTDILNNNSINYTTEKVTGVYGQNNENKTPEKSKFYNEKTNYGISNINEIETELNKKKSYTLDEIGEKWSDIQEIIYDTSLNDDMYVELEEDNGKLEAVLYDGAKEDIEEVNRVPVEKTKNGRYTAEAINNAIKKAATIQDENKPIKGQVDIEGNEVRSMKKGGKENGRKQSTHNGQKINREQEGKNTSREEKDARSNELAKRKQSKGLQNYQEQQQEKLGKDFKATIVEESKQSNNEKTVSKGFKEATGLDVTVFNTNKNTTEAAFYSDDNIYLKHNSLANKKATNFKPYHEFGHWLKNNNYKAWKSLYDIIDNSITKQQIESYKNVLNDKSIFDNMTEAEERDYVINEIVSDYIGNWANDIMNWTDFLPNLSKEYQQYLADIALENQVTGYNMFGTVEQQEQMNNQITEIMKDIIIDKKIEHSNDNILFSNRKDIDMGNYWQIEDSKDLFKGITSTKDLQDKAYKYILNGNTNYKTITDKVDGKNVKFARISAKEYVYGRNNKKLQGNQYQEKMRAAPSIDDLIKHADIKYHSPLTHKNKLFPNGYNNYQGKVGIDNDIFRYIVRIGKTKNNESIFYDVSLELLKQQKEADNKVLRTNNSSSQKSASINNSISQKKQNVKSGKDTVNNKSIYNNSKNTSTTKIKKSNRKDIDNINYDFPENVKDIKNTNTFLKKAIQNETDKYWSEQLKDALRSNYVYWTRKESPLKWRRRIIQQYLDYKNKSDIKYSNRYDTDENNNYGFYSQLENVIEQKMPNTSNAKQISGLLNNSGIKQDELKWIGLDDYLKAHSLEKISKEQLLDYIKANQINIETVEKGISKLAQYTEPVKQDIADKNIDIQYILDKYGFDYEKDDLVPYKRDGLRAGTIGDFMAENLEKYIDLSDFDKYEKQEDGSYIHMSRDDDGIAWTHQFTEQDFKEDMQKLEDLYEQRSEAEMELSSLEDEYGDYADELGVPKYEKYSLEGGDNYKELLYTLPEFYEAAKHDFTTGENATIYNNLPLANTQTYQSPHWEEKNVLAHARTKDFEDTSGNKVLYIDEIQSDLHQEGRKRGYMSKEDSQNQEKNRQRKSELGDELRLLNQTYNNKLDEYLENTDAYKAWVDAQNDLGTVKYNLVKKIAEKNNIKDYETYNFIDEIQRDFENDTYTIKDVDKIIDREAEDVRLALTIKGWKLTSVLKEDLRNMYKATKNLMEARENKLNSRAKSVAEFRNTEEAKNFERRQQEISDEIQTITTHLYGISDIFPFKKNWHEFVLRRLINNAVQNGYDEVAWSTGRQQRERYNLAKTIDKIEYQRFYNHPNDVDKGKVGEVEIAAYKDNQNIFDKSIKAEELADYIGKDLATKILTAKEGKGTISNLDEVVNENPNSGMYLFYDQEIPNYLNKYLKKWNSKVEEITLKDADGKDESKQMGFKITDEMRNSIRQNGQPLFSNRNDLDNEIQDNVKQDDKQKERLNLANKIKNENNVYFAKRTVNDNGIRNAERGESYIEQEIQKIEKTGNWDNTIPVTKLTDIRKTIEDYLGVGIKKGHFRQKAYAIYKGNNDVIRTKEYKDMDSILHETGHALDIGNRLKVDKEAISNELLTAIDKLGGYERETRTVKLKEGFAEIIREYAIVPEQAKQDYPQTVAVLEGLRKADKEFNNFITKVQQQSYNYIHQNPRNRTLSNISIGEQTDKKNITKNYIKQEVMRNIYDKDWIVKSAVNELAKANNKTANQIKASENAYYLTRLAAGTTDKTVSMLSDGYIDEKGNKLFPGLSGIGEILGNDPKRWNDLRAYLVAQRDLEYKAKTLKTGIRTMDSKAVVEQFKNDKQIKEASKLIYDTLNGVMQYAVDNGLIEQQTADKLKQSNAFYVPMQRVLENRGNQVGRKGAVADIIKQRTGSELDVKDVLENIIANSSNIIRQVENNNVLKAFYKEGQSTGLTGAIYDVIPTPMTKIGTAQLSTWENELKKQGVNTADLDLEKTIDIFAPNKKVDQQNLITSFINDDGKRVYLQFDDDILFNSLMNMDKKFMSKWLKFNSKANMPLRYGATMANLGFAIPNMISDTAQAAIYSTAGFIPVVDNALGVLDILASKNKSVRNFVNSVAPEYAKKINYLYSLYEQSGATNSTRLSQFRESTQNLMKDVYGTKSETLGIQEKYKPLKRLLDILTYIPEISEQSTRFRVFEKNYEYYKNKGTAEMDSRILAALESRDATQDFGRTGNLTREINQLIPFSAARVGSAYTFSEKIKANPKQVGMRIAILTAIAMAIKGMGYDDKEIEELNQRKKDDNFVIRIGDEIATIKKPQGLLRSIVNLAEYIQDLATGHIEEGKEGEKLGEWLHNTLTDNLPADNPGGYIPNLAKPIAEYWVNKNFYYNTDIVKNYDLDMPDSEQYYDYNSQLAIILGKIFNQSPAKIDNLISGYFGGLGTSVTGTIDYALGKAGVIPEKAEMGAEQDAIGKRFIVNVNTNSSSIDEIYNRKTELTKLKNGGTITSEQEQELDTIKSAISNISDINKQIKEIKKDLTMSGKDKAEKIKELQQEKTDTARKALGKELIHQENEEKIQSTQFYPSDTLKKSGYTLTLDSEMKKEYEQYAYEFYSKYEKQGIYSEEKLKDIKAKAKDYAKNMMIKNYRSNLVKTK